MSLRGELVRLGLRWSLKRRSAAGASIAERRRQMTASERFVPNPPHGTETRAVDADGVPGFRIATPGSRPDRHILFLHGGGFIAGRSATYRHFTWRIAAAARARVLSIDYRLAPEHPFPAALDDALAAYRWLVAKAPAARVALLGDSAGGGLALSLLLRLRDEGIGLPAACVALSPWTDLTLSGRSLRQNAASDPMLAVEALPETAAAYLAGGDARAPYASPIFGQLAGLPPVLLQVGSDEILRDDAVRMAERLRAAGGDVELEIWPRMPHVWHLFAPILPEARRAIVRLGAFLDRRL